MTMVFNQDRVFIIAEAGVNHNSSLVRAKQMIDAATEAGVDCVKFQTFKAENIISTSAPKADYQLENTEKSETQFEMLKKLELDMDAHVELMDYCLKKKIMFLSTAFDLESIDVLKGLGLRLFKIPSGEITNLPYLRKIGALNFQVILSTGMSTMSEIGDAIKVLSDAGTPKDKITVLHCNTDYPTCYEDVNLQAMNNIKKTYQVNIGYSDHTLGVCVSVAAVALGAKVIEKHFTLDKTLEGPDHKASLEPDELKRLVEEIRNIEMSLGDEEKKPSKSELKNILIVRKSIVANRNIQKGEVFSEDNLAVKRPGDGINPMKWDDVIGVEASQSFLKDEAIVLK